MPIVNVRPYGGGAPAKHTADWAIFHRLYVIEYASGYVKVGQTKAPMTRWSVHRGQSRKVGDRILRVWFSSGHINAFSNEVALIKFCAERWAALAGRRERFACADFDQVVAAAEALSFERFADERLTEQQIEQARKLDAALAALSLAVAETAFEDVTA